VGAWACIWVDGGLMISAVFSTKTDVSKRPLYFSSSLLIITHHDSTSQVLLRSWLTAAGGMRSVWRLGCSANCRWVLCAVWLVILMSRPFPMQVEHSHTQTPHHSLKTQNTPTDNQPTSPNITPHRPTTTTTTTTTPQRPCPPPWTATRRSA